MKTSKNSQQLYSSDMIFNHIDSYSYINELIGEKTSLTKRFRTGETFTIDGVPYELTKLSPRRYGVKETATNTEFSEVEFAAYLGKCTINEILSCIVNKSKIIIPEETADEQNKFELDSDKAKTTIKEVALSYLAENLSIIPVNSDKTSPFLWKEFQTALPTQKQIETRFNQNTFGIAIICGKISEGLEIIDEDCKYDTTGNLHQNLKKLIDELAPGLYKKLVIETTMSGGYHLIYRCKNFEGNLKLASRPATSGELMKHPREKQKVLIETRGEGGYFVCAPTPGYSLVQGDFNYIHMLTEEERNTIIYAAQTFNQISSFHHEPSTKKSFNSKGLSQFEDYNKRGDCITLLEKHGWSIVGGNSEKVILKRPGDTKAKHSAYFDKDKNWFSVFSSSTEFETKKAYLPYAVFAVLECNGNFSEASSKLYELGYGERKVINHTIKDAKLIENEELEDDLTEELINTPKISDEVYQALPDFLTRGCSAFSDDREKDVYLTGAITIISGCFPNATGMYDGRTVHGNLNCFIIAPAASGKGALSSAKDLGMVYHRKLLNESKELLRLYKIELRQYQIEMRNSKGKSTSEPPIEPKFRILFIPANSSSASIIQTLEGCNGCGIICETEADTMGGALKHDWGGYSDMLRKGFHHEPITYKRKTNNEYVEVEHPKISTALSGTPVQVMGLIPNAEDGLFSRFIYYTFKVEQKWRDVSPQSGRVNLTEYFATLSQELKIMIEHIETGPVSIDLSQKQWDVLNRLFSIWLNEVNTFISEDVGSTVKRLSVIVFRIAMVLTILRKFENESSDTKLICTDLDFETALKLAAVYREHAILMYKKLPKESGAAFNSGRQKIFDALPNDFTRQEAITIGASLRIKPSTIDKYLKIFLRNYIKKTDYGKYQKL